MNLDLLIKLVKLANNNPNEHEANSAARRACKLIAEGDYKFTANVAKPTNNKTTSGWSPVDDYVKRNTPPAQPKTNSYYYDRYSYGFDWGKTASSYSKESPKKPQTKRECSECGKELFTDNTNLYYICTDCYRARNDPFYSKA